MASLVLHQKFLKPSTTMASLVLHQKSAEHCPCPHCVLLDSYILLLESQLPPIICPECEQGFSHKVSLEAHQLEELHASCYVCSVVFPTRALYASHMQTHPAATTRPLSPATQFWCCDCERDFKSEGALTNHLHNSSVHRSEKGSKKKKKKKKKKNKEPNQQEQEPNEQEQEPNQQEQEPNHQEQETPRKRCEKCNKTFKNRNSLRSHLSSVRHHPISDIECLADTKCKKRFNCPSGQLHHLESGKCLSGMTKTKLNGAIAAKDTAQIVTLGGVMAQLLEDNLSASASSTSQTRSPILTPTSTEFLGSYPPSLPSPVLTPEFASSTSTNFHSMLTHRLRSQSGFVHAQVSISLPVLDDISFHCPRILMGEGSQKRPLRQFSTVSGLAQHLESGICNGGTGTLRRVVEYIQEEMKGMGFGELKLLK